MSKKKMVGSNEVQAGLGISWPPAHRFIDKYGYSKEIIQDPVLGYVVPEDVALAVIKAFKNETQDGRRVRHNYPRLDRYPSLVVQRVKVPGE